MELGRFGLGLRGFIKVGEVVCYYWGMGVGQEEFENQRDREVQEAAEMLRTHGMPPIWKRFREQINTVPSPDAHLGATEEV